jgi:hypothetical protein
VRRPLQRRYGRASKKKVLNPLEIEDARLASEAGGEAGRLFAESLGGEEGDLAAIREEAKQRTADAIMFDHERAAYVIAFIAAAREAIGI